MLPGVQTENSHRDGNGEFEVVAGSRERERGRLRVVDTELLAHPEAHQDIRSRVQTLLLNEGLQA